MAQLFLAAKQQQQLVTPLTYAAVAVAQQLLLAGKAASIQVQNNAALQEPSVQFQSHKASGVQSPRFLARTFSDGGLYGASALESTEIDQWVDFAHDSLQSTDYKLLSVAFTRLNSHLKMRTFLVNYRLTLADVVVWGYLRGSNIWTRVSKSKGDGPIYLIRWFQHFSSLPFATATAEVIAKMQQELKAKSKAEAGSGSSNSGGQQGSLDIDLPGASMGNVVTRFPPEPSGYLHIGHTKAALLNQHFAQMYKGKLIVRFDDTNPSKEKVEFEESILEDLELLGIRGDSLTWTSDYFPKMYEFALQLIKKNLAYADDTVKEQMRKERMDGIASKCRDIIAVEENLRRFEEMKLGSEEGLTYCLRAKMSVDAKNKALRDPVIYRCNLLPHNRTGDQWKMYPTYDFACPIVDSIEGVTHALRTNEYHDRNDQYYWFIDQLGLRKPHIWDYSRMNFVYTLLSKRKLQWFVDEKKVPGWDDPRFPTVRGILRRGLTLEALKKYILLQGASRNTILLEWDKLWTLNKQIIDPIAPRFVGLNKPEMRKVLLVDGPAAPFEKEMPKHKKNPDVGTKITTFSKVVLLEGEDAKDLTAGEEVTLMDWGNIIIKKVLANADGVLEAQLHLEGDFKKTKKKLTWLPDIQSLTPLKLHDYDYLITKKKLEEEDTFQDCLNTSTEFITDAVGDANLKTLKKSEIIQLERRGYFICDEPISAEHPFVKLISIPDGRAASTALKAAVPPASGR